MGAASVLPAAPTASKCGRTARARRRRRLGAVELGERRETLAAEHDGRVRVGAVGEAVRVVEADLDADVGLRMDAGSDTPLSQGALRIN